MSASRRDLAVAAAWLALGGVLLAAGVYPLWPAVALWEPGRGAGAVALGALVALATVRSRWPLAVLPVAAVVTAGDILHGGTLGALIVFTDLVYAAVKYSSEQGLRRALHIALIAAAAWGAALLLWRPGTGAYQASVQWLLIIAISVMWGWNVRSERRRTEALLAAEHAEEQLRLQRQIAHDLHDLVANHISVAGLHVEAAKLLTAANPAGAASGRLAESLAKAKVGTDHAQAELRTLIRVLTGTESREQPPPSPLPGGTGDLGQLDHLLPAGRRLLWRPDREALTRALDDHCAPAALARALTEAVANAAKHGSGDVTVGLTTAPEAGVEITVTNEIAGTRLSPPPGTGSGLAGAKRLLGASGAQLTTHTERGLWTTTIHLPRPVHP